MVGNRYYKRYNCITAYMEEYEVRNLYNRVSRSLLQINPPAIQINHKLFGLNLNDISIQADILIENIGRTVENDFKVDVALHKEFYQLQGYDKESFTPR